jgi:aerobic-type carbon monoxide dehydrogenase small subunit (CoxS/CutS family)
MKRELTVNGEVMRFEESERGSLLIDFLHEQGKTGTKFGCGIGACGSCKVAVQEKEGGEVIPVLACYARLESVEGLRVTTVEGLAGADGKLHALQQAFLDAFAFQCGYSTPGMLMAGYTLIKRLERQKGIQQRFLDREITAAMSGHVCRCTGYVRYHQAIRSVIERWEKVGGGPPLVLPDPDPKAAVAAAPAPSVWFRVTKRSHNDLRDKVLEGRFERPRAWLSLPPSMAWDACRGGVAVHLADLRTGEPARDLNLRKFLFAGVHSIAFEIEDARPLDRQVPNEALPTGSSVSLEVQGTLRVGEAAAARVTACVNVTAGDGYQLFVRTRQPIRLPLRDLGLPVETFARTFGLTLGAELELGLDDIDVTYGAR